MTPWSPLARGVLTGSYKGGFDKGATKRSQGGDAERAISLYRGDMEFDIVDRVAELAEKRGHSSRIRSPGCSANRSSPHR